MAGGGKIDPDTLAKKLFYIIVASTVAYAAAALFYAVLMY